MNLQDKIKNAEETMWPMTMGMSIDEAILTIKNAIRFTYDDVYEEAFAMAIETMRKYQKIKEQVDIAIDKENFAISDARLIQIREIINGNDD